MLDRIRYTIVSVFDFYRAHGLRHVGFATAFLMVSLVLSGILAVSVCWAAVQVFDLRSIDGGLMRTLDMGDEPALLEHWLTLLSHFTVFSFAIAGLCYMGTGRDAAQALRVGDVSGILGAAGRDRLVVLLAVLWLSELILFRGAIANGSWDPAYWDAEDVGSSFGAEVHSMLITWINALTEFVKRFLPYLFAFAFVAATISGLPILKAMARHRQALAVVLVIAFCVDAVQADVFALFKTLVLPPLLIPFHDPVIPGILASALGVFVASWFLPAYAGILWYPIGYSPMAAGAIGNDPVNAGTPADPERVEEDPA
jgi:hypothetical protein